MPCAFNFLVTFFPIMKLTYLIPWTTVVLSTISNANSFHFQNTTSNKTSPGKIGRYPSWSNSTGKGYNGSNSTYPNKKNSTGGNRTEIKHKLKGILGRKAYGKGSFPGYAPTQVNCPSNGSLIREANSISPEEAAWVRARHVKTDAAIREYLSRVGVNYPQTGFDVHNNTKPINIALAFSGGGLRSMLTGAGEFAALDNRSSLATQNGLGGVLQSSTYIAGLSGGSWLLATLIYQDWPTIDEVVFENPYNVWDYTTFNTFFNTSSPASWVYNFDFVDYEESLARLAWWNFPVNKGIKMDLRKKRDVGFPVTVTDAWGRVLAHLLFRKGDDNWMESATWSGIQEIPGFANQDMPFPIITALARRPNSLRYDVNSPIVEFNPYEMGSFDTSINTFHDLQYLGSAVVNGTPTGHCYTGYDNAAFVVGTSSSMFNTVVNKLVCPGCKPLGKVLKFFVKRLLRFMSRHNLDIAWFEPNPFYGSEYAASEAISTSDTLYLMDGGLAGEIVPLSTLAVKERELDLVFAFDNDGHEWPQGTSLINTYQRQFSYEGASTVFPYVPGQSTFTHHNLTARPTFFGCNARNLTGLAKDGVIPPLVIYLANRPYEFYSNTSTMKITYSDSEKKGMVANGFDIASQGNHTASPNWQMCVGCAMVRRAEERNNATQSQQCQQCFQQYCWDGSLYEEMPYLPPENFTVDGRTNEPMDLDMHNHYIHRKSNTRSFALKLKKSIKSKLTGWF